MKLVSATKFDQKTVALIDTEIAVDVHNVSIIKTEDGTIKAMPPFRAYKAKDDTTKFDRVVTFKSGDEVNNLVATMLEGDSKKIYLFDKPSQTKNGEKIGLATVSARVVLKVDVFHATKEKPARLVLPFREYEQDGKKRRANYVWPFTTTGDELKAEINALTEEILSQAKPYEPKAGAEEN